MKTLFIKIDNTPVPVEAENEIAPLDCKQINDFCSFAGDVLVGDLKDNNGTPFYRLINPVGRLLSDFEKVDKANYDHIIAQWLDILGEMLHKGVTQCDEQFIIHLPQQYVDWLLCNENDYYVEIGKCLQSTDSKVYLDANGISEDIISTLHMNIRRFLNDNKDDIKYIVFSNPRIQNSSNIVKMMCMEDSQAYVLERIEWENQLKEASKEQISISNMDDVPEKQNLLEEKDLIIKVKDVSFKMIFVKGGTFTMGATYEQGSSAESRERPNHIVTLSNFFIGETVVTQALWTAIMGDNPSEFKGLNYPVQSVTWYRSQEFINKLNSLTSYNFRLPTEAEWEFAARGGIKSRHFKYAGSNDINKVGWFNRNYREGPHPVAQKSPNELGLFDMSGNVHEWCNDWYGKYESSSQNNPKGPTFGNKKVARGGFWYVSDSVSRVTCRRRWNPSSHGFSFRLALSSYNDINQNSDSIMNIMVEEGKMLEGKLVSYINDDMNIDDIPTSIDRI